MNSSKLVPIFLSWLIWILGGAYFYHSYCGHETIVISEQEAQAKTNSEGTVELRNDAKVFKANSFEMLQPLSIGLSNQVSEYLEGMKSDENKQLKIIGLYKESESNSSLYPNLGYARANNLKQLFLQNGIDPARIVLEGQVTENQDSGLEFSYVKDLGRAEIEDYKMLFEHNPIILYFGSNQEELYLSAEQRSDFLDLINYLDVDGQLKIDVSGFTDNIGDREANIKLSKDRARFVEKALIENGVAANRINVMAYGPERPLANNKTSEGRAKNRRVEISVE